MRDGVMLLTDIYRPDAPGNFPTLLWRTPYSNNGGEINTQAHWYASRGYVVVKQDVRGKCDSGGTFVPFRNEANDGYDTEMWIGHQPWSDEYEWPLARAQFTKYYIASDGRANSAAGDGTLSTAAPGGADAGHFNNDPANPVPTLGGNTCCSVVPNGPRDQRDAEIRRDVLVYTTPAPT